MRQKIFISFSLLLLFTIPAIATNTIDDIKLKFSDSNIIFESYSVNKLINYSGNMSGQFNNETINLIFQNGKAIYNLEVNDAQLVFLKFNSIDIAKLVYINTPDKSTKEIPFWLAIIPPLLAIVFALITKEVLMSIFFSIFIGSFFINGMHFSTLLFTFFATITDYIVPAMSNTDHIAIIVFSLFTAGIVGIISKNGGMAAIVEKLSIYANSVRNAQLVTWFLGIAIFFDDYANTLIVGNTMRSITDKFKISREKLAYIVDSTAAPVAAIAFITTWIGAELGYINDATQTLGLNIGAYAIFLNSLKYAYYPVFTLVFMVFLIWMKREFGPMLHAERGVKKINTKTIEQGSDYVIHHEKGHWLHGFIPIFTLITITFYGLIHTGIQNSSTEIQSKWYANLSTILGNANSYDALLWGSASGLFIAIIITVFSRIYKLTDTIEHMIAGFKTIVHAILILVLAWALSVVLAKLHTADFFISLLQGNISPYWLPAMTFVLAGIVSFSTGSSWGTMAILYPFILPLAWALAQSAELPHEESLSLFYNVTAIVLAGSVFGDHCSPISDTTILSSLATDCNHISHVKTQMPYAMTVGIVSIIAGGLFPFLGIPWYIAYLFGFLLLFLIVKYYGKEVSGC